jgi:hypothetical protein
MSARLISVKVGSVALIVACLVVGGWAQTASTLYSHGKAIPLVDSYACTQPDMLNDGKLITIVAFTDGAIDKAAVKAADDPCRELTHQVGRNFKTLAELKLKYDGTAYNVQIYDAEGTSSRNGDATLKLTRNDGKRVEGTYIGKDPAKKRAADGVFYDFHFALDVVNMK